jgi:peptidyl-prolyl cis-trans isomerase A (cyclophilin A)
VVDALYKGYGEGAPRGQGPRQDLIQRQGNAYLDNDFPKLDKLIRATLVGG